MFVSTEHRAMAETEKQKRMYPLRFGKIEKEQAWGRETVALSDLGIADSVAEGGWLDGNSLGDIMETYLDRVTGEKPYYFFGRQFPLMVRTLDVDGKMPLLVCPDDTVAGERFDSLGKAKLWYVLDAKEGAGIVEGFSRDVTASELYAIATGSGQKMTVPDSSVLNIVVPKKGDAIRISPGTVHCAFGKVRILEIAESSGLDIEIWNWGEAMDAEELGVVEALDFINLGKHKPLPAVFQPEGAAEGTRQLAMQDEFRVAEIDLSNPMHVFPSESDLYLIYTCIRGSICLEEERPGGKESLVADAGDTVLVPAEVKDIVLMPRESGTVLLESTSGDRKEKDEYIDESVPAQIDGEDYDEDPIKI